MRRIWAFPEHLGSGRPDELVVSSYTSVVGWLKMRRRSVAQLSPPSTRNEVTDTVHALLADTAVAAVALGIGWSALLALTGRGGGAPFGRYEAISVGLVAVAAASGLVLIATGAQPADGLHLLYAVVATAAIPLARSFFGGARGRGAGAAALVAFVVLGAVLYRLFTTG